MGCLIGFSPVRPHFHSPLFPPLAYTPASPHPAAPATPQTHKISPVGLPSRRSSSHPLGHLIKLYLLKIISESESPQSSVAGSRSDAAGHGTPPTTAVARCEATMEDQRKRTLEALERRFAQAKAELQTQQQRSKKRPAEDKERVASNIESSSPDSTVKKSFSSTPSRKGNFFSGHHTSKQDVEVIEPAYFNLSHSVDENLLPTNVEVSDRKLTVDRVLHELFQHGDSAQKYMQGSKSMKIENTILLDNYVQRNGMSSGCLSRALKNGSKRSKKHMSIKQHKRSGSFDLPKEFHNFELFKPMHEKWKSYVVQLLKIVGKDQLPQCFLNADLHGAIILVVQCKVPAYVGIHGIMVRETKETFGIITQDNKFRGSAYVFGM
ncbi:UNVERIFIED_CONTAM: hypothetical protein Sradi_5917700 [Sesamum radiatum]|uniref:Uncharacterized protein n=1 Tax=Sesamum radiatum TaxID=300843 RepID=A0AAW2KSR3_SESRA